MNALKRFLAVTCLLALLCGCSAPAAQEEEVQEETPQVEESVSQEETPTDDNALVGTWIGDGTMDIMGLEHDIEFVNVWTFHSDGTAVAEKTKEDGSTETLNFTYQYTDDTLTFVKESATCGIGYTLEDDTLTFRTGVDTYAVFTREK